MVKLLNLIFKHKFYLFLTVLCCFGYSYLFMDRAHVEVEFFSKQKSTFEMYWADSDGGYSQYKRVETHVRPHSNQYSFYLTDLRKIGKIRVDTHNFPGEVTIKSIKISQPGYGEITLNNHSGWDMLVPLHNIDQAEVTKNGLAIVSSNNDPMFELQIPAPTTSTSPYVYLVHFLIIAVFLWLILKSVGKLNEQFAYVPMLLFGILLLITVIACTTRDSYHPDEGVHAAAAAYYIDHWKPPVVEDETIRHTYSVYGSSRLNSGEIYYFIAGKFAKLLEVLPLDGHLPYRLFNVFLFSLIFLRTLLTPQTRLLAIPFLISPQLWYAFSYCTSDAFALFIAFGAGCQVLVDDSFFNNYLRDRFSLKQIGRVALTGVCFSLLFLLKSNFYPYIAAVAVVILTSWYVDKYQIGRGRFFKKCIAVGFVTLCFLAVHKSVDVSVNGWDKKERVVKLQNEIAEPMFNMTSPLEVRSPLFTIKERGTSLHTLLVAYRWFEKSFRSSFGLYGHSTIMGPEGYYNGVRWFGGAFLIFFIGSILLRSPWVYKGETLVLLGLSGALIAASIHHSWTMEIQAQGRYLFPIFSMFGLMYARNYKYINDKMFTMFVTGMFLLSSWSFIIEAIDRIPGR